MPYKAMPLCKRTGCKNIPVKDSPYCSLHQTPTLKMCNNKGCKNLTKERYCLTCTQELHRIDSNNRKDRHKNYAKHWRRLSKSYRNAHPLCENCLIEDKYIPSECVDHIDGNPKNNNNENLQALCWSCHSKKTSAQLGGWGKARGGAGKLSGDSYSRRDGTGSQTNPQLFDWGHR